MELSYRQTTQNKGRVVPLMGNLIFIKHRPVFDEANELKIVNRFIIRSGELVAEI